MTDLSTSDKLQCWVIARNTVQKFDDILTKLSFQGLTILAAALSVTGYLFLQGIAFVAILTCIGIIVASIALASHTWLYFRLLEKAVATAMEWENELFPAVRPEMKLTKNLRKVPGKESFPVLMSVHIIMLIVAIGLLVIYSLSLN